MISIRSNAQRRAMLAAGAAVLALSAYPSAAAAQASSNPGLAPAPAAAAPASATTAQSTGNGSTAASPAAPSPAGQSGSGLQEIVVTARRVSENLQTVPTSVGTLAPQALQARQIFGLNDLKSAVAGLTTYKSPAPGGAYYTIRGVTGSALTTPSADSAVGFYFDGIYIARVEGQGVDVPDLASVEVLRGPQGTLFGRNTAAGAINLITNVPTSKPELKYDVLYGNYDQRRASVVANVPITDTLFARVAYLHKQIDGDVHNDSSENGAIYAGYGSFKPIKRNDASNDDTVVGRLRYIGIPNLTIDYKFDYANRVETSQANQIIAFLPDQQTAGANILLGILLPSQTGQIPTSFKRLNSVPAGLQSPSKIVNQGHQLTAEYRASDTITLKNITSWRSVRATSFSDLDGGDWTFEPFGAERICVVCSYNNLHQNQYSQEDQVIGKFDRFNFIAGGYYFIEHSHFSQLFNTFALIPNPPAVYTPPQTPTVTLLGAQFPGPYALGEVGDYRNRSYAGYVHGDYELSDVFKLSAGGRYTIDDRQTDDLRSFGAGAQAVTYRKFTYDGSINAQIDRNKLAFAKYSTGYVSGGIFGGITFKPETDQQVEVGIKTEWLDHKLRVNGSLFYTWRKNLQQALPSLTPDVNATLAARGFLPPYPVGLLVTNTPGTSTVRGGEIEITYVPVRGLTLNANYSYADPHYADHALQTAPKSQFSFSSDYSFPKFANDSYLTVRLDGDYRSIYYGTGLNVPGLFTGPVNPVLLAKFGYAADQSDAYDAAARKAARSGGYWLVNGRVSLADIQVGGSKAKISGFVQNIFNVEKSYYTLNATPLVTGSFERPRTYGVELNLDF